MPAYYNPEWDGDEHQSWLDAGNAPDLMWQAQFNSAEEALEHARDLASGDSQDPNAEFFNAAVEHTDIQHIHEGETFDVWVQEPGEAGHYETQIADHDTYIVDVYGDRDAPSEAGGPLGPVTPPIMQPFGTAGGETRKKLREKLKR